jgi:hypothetical protein
MAGDLCDDLDRDSGGEHIGNGAVTEIMEPGLDAASLRDLVELVGYRVRMPGREHAPDILSDGLQGLDGRRQERDQALAAPLPLTAASPPLPAARR